MLLILCIAFSTLILLVFYTSITVDEAAANIQVINRQQVTHMIPHLFQQQLWIEAGLLLNQLPQLFNRFLKIGIFSNQFVDLFGSMDDGRVIFSAKPCTDIGV